MNNNYYAILMAGGVGSRFWPMSTSDFPKQFHDMLGSGETLIQKTYKRLAHTIPEKNILILSHSRYEKLIMEQLPQVDKKNIVLEPEMRNTAPCILYASLKINKINPKAMIVVAPSDHWIEDEEQFTANLKDSFEICEHNKTLMTFGIIPTYPSTGYGYIEYNKLDKKDVKKVVQFIEKPNYITARKFVESRHYLWNSGIFVWNISTILDAYKEFQPQMYQLFIDGYEYLNTDKEDLYIGENYSKSENISVDYAIMEKARNMFVLPATFDWNDLGTWSSLSKRLPKDEMDNAAINADVIFENASNNIVRTDKNKKVIVNGLKDYIIVEKGDILLIYPKDKEQEIKKVSKHFNSEE